MKKLISLMLVAAIIFSGCAGPVTGIEYNPKDVAAVVYKVAKNGVVTFMTKEEIEAAKLDKVANTVEYAYSVLNDGTMVENEGLSVQ